MNIIVCIPGSSFSGRFMDCLIGMISFFMGSNIKCLISRMESNNIYFARNLCLGGDVMRGANQKPFDGKGNYDFILWIDSDIIFKPPQIMHLIQRDLDIVSGLYFMEGGSSFATVKEWDTEFFKERGHFNFLTPADMKDAKEPFEVAYTGLGFMLIKKGIIETMNYPWFEPRKHEIGDMVDYSMEDVSFCLKAQEKGFKIQIDPKIIVGHEKRTVL